MARILLDCSAIRLDGIPTGVPRVVANYIKCGEVWAAERGCEVVAVVPHERGLVVAYNTAIRRPRRALARIPRPPLVQRVFYELQVAWDNIADRSRLVVFHMLLAFGLLLPVPHGWLERAGSRASKLLFQSLSVITPMLDSVRKRLGEVKLRPGDVLFCPAYWFDVNPNVYRHLREQGCRVNFLIHDILPITHPQYYTYRWRENFKKRFYESLSYVETYFCVSEETRRSVANLAELAGMSAIRTTTSHNGLDPLPVNTHVSLSQRITDVLMQHSHFLLMVGTIEPKKNHIYVLDQLTPLWREGFEDPLLIVGRGAWMSDSIIEHIRNHPYLNKKIFWFDQVDDNSLAVLYRRARFLVFASEAEGFGLPMIEALSCGLPVLAYDIEIVREIAGDFARYFDRVRNHLGDLVLEYSPDDTYERLRASLRTFEWPGWQKVVSAVFDELVSASVPASHADPLSSRSRSNEAEGPAADLSSREIGAS